jgi:hypothetical protein
VAPSLAGFAHADALHPADVLSAHAQRRRGRALSGPLGALSQDGNAASGARLVAWPGCPRRLFVALRSVSPLKVSNINGERFGEPKGEPTSADVWPHQATTSHGFRS